MNFVILKMGGGYSAIASRGQLELRADSPLDLPMAPVGFLPRIRFDFFHNTLRYLRNTRQP